MKPDPESVLAWLRQLAAARIIELTPRAMLDVEALLRLPLAADPAGLAAGLASLLAHDETSWRQVEESFLGWCRSLGVRKEEREADERSEGVERREQRVFEGPVIEEEPGGVWWRRWVEATGGWQRWQWLVLLGVIAVAGVQGTLTLVGTVEELVDPGEQGSTGTGAALESPDSPGAPEILPVPATTKPPEVSFEPVVSPRKVPSRTTETRGQTQRPEPLWALGVLLLGSLALAGLAVRWWTSGAAYREDVRRIAEAAAGRRRRALREIERLGTPYHVEVVPPLPPEVIEDAATLLARLTAPHPGWELDVEPTIARTIDAGGRVTPAYVPEAHRAPLVVLVDVEAPDHPDRYRVERLLARWQRGGLSLVRYDFSFRPAVLTPWPRGKEASLDELAARHEDAPLLVISRWVRPEDYAGRLDWLEPLTRWPNRAWLDPDPRVLDELDDDARAQRLEIEGSGLPRFPFTAKGLLACARTLKARGEHPAPLRDEALPSVAELGEVLWWWAACACVVPDPIWPQLDAIRRELPELAARLPDARYVHRLIEWVQVKGVELDPTDRRLRARVARLGLGDRLVLSRGQRRRLLADLRKRRPDLHARARELVIGQLEAADVEGDPLEAQRRALKLDLHRAVLDPRKAKALLGKWAHTAVSGELRVFMEDERAVQEIERSGVRWSSGVWKAFEAWTTAAAGKDEWARPADVLRPRPWTPMRRRLVAGAMLAVAGSYGAWWMVAGEEVEHEVVRWEDVVLPATWEVKRPGEMIEEDAKLKVPCADEVALQGVATMRMKCVEGGRFLMGSPEGEEGRYEDEGPQHIAKVGSLLVGETEVTQGQWKAVMGTEPFDCTYGCGDEHPAQNVSWNQAVEFMNELTKKENASRPAGEQLSACYAEGASGWEWSNRSCTGYRLPTETEWEYAARATTTTAYSFGDDVKKLDEYAWHDGNSGYSTHPVKLKKANPRGLYDVHGNVWEWVWDWYGRYEGDTKAGHIGPDGGDMRVLRGGSFGHVPRNLRSALRNWGRPTSAVRLNGFRCVRGVWLPEPSTP